MNQLSTSGGQSIGVAASASVLPMNIQDWFSLGLTGLVFLGSKGPSRVFSNTTVQKHQFFSAQLSLWPNSHIHTNIKRSFRSQRVPGCDGAGAAKRSYPTTKVRGGGWEEQPHVQGVAASWAQEGLEELLHIQGQEGRPWGDTARPR